MKELLSQTWTAAAPRGRKFLQWLILLTMIACSHGNCRENEAAKEKINPALKKDVNVTTVAGPQNRVKVFKYDGSLQCAMGKAITVEQMKADLKNLKTYSQENKADSLMHIQQCGTPTGKANVFEIDRKDLEEAKKLGFKEWLWD